MAEKVPFDTQKCRYILAQEVLDLEPWAFLDEQDTFAVQATPADDIFYLCGIGSAGISRSFIFYRGAGGWEAFMRILSGEAETSDLIHILDSTNLDFEPRKNIPPEERKRLQRFGYPPPRRKSCSPASSGRSFPRDTPGRCGSAIWAWASNAIGRSCFPWSCCSPKRRRASSRA